MDGIHMGNISLTFERTFNKQMSNLLEIEAYSCVLTPPKLMYVVVDVCNIHNYYGKKDKHVIII